MEQYINNHLYVIEILCKTVPWILIAGWTLYSILVVFFRALRKSISNFYIIESIPNVFVTLGLFGTFTGIAYGLMEFDTSPDKIKESIKILLDGLKLAMLTSITGILLSLIFSKIINIGVSSKHIIPPESPELIELRNLNQNFLEFKNAISTSHYNALVESLKDVLRNFNKVFADFIGELVEQNFQELSETINQLTSWQKEHKEDVIHLKKAYRDLVAKHTEFVNRTNEWVAKLEEVSGQSSRLQRIIDEFNDAFNEDGNLSRILGEVKQASSELREASTQFSEITSKMNDTGSAVQLTGDKITEWTNSVQKVSANSQIIVEKVEALQTINTRHIDDLVEQFNARLKGTFGTFDALIQEYIKNIENKTNNK